MVNKNPKKENLILNSDRTPIELKEIATKGGKKSGEVRRQKKLLKEELELLLSISKRGKTEQEKICISLMKEAKRGNVKAFEGLRDTIGQKPVDKHELVANKELEAAYEEIEKVLFDEKGSNT